MAKIQDYLDWAHTQNVQAKAEIEMLKSKLAEAETKLDKTGRGSTVLLKFIHSSQRLNRPFAETPIRKILQESRKL